MSLQHLRPSANSFLFGWFLLSSWLAFSVFFGWLNYFYGSSLSLPLFLCISFCLDGIYDPHGLCNSVTPYN